MNTLKNDVDEWSFKAYEWQSHCQVYLGELDV